VNGKLIPQITPEKLKHLYLTAIIDFLKVNLFRIATHSLQRTPSPLSYREDIKPFLPLVIDAEGGLNMDILALDNESRLTFCRAIYHDEIIPHWYNDVLFIKSIKTVLESNLTNVHFIFITNGVIMPDLVLKAEWDKLIAPMAEISSKIPVIEFYEARINPVSLIKLSNHKLYQKKIISNMKRLHQEYFESDIEFEGEKTWEGRFDIQYHGKILTLPYWISPDSGVQLNSPDTTQRISEFVEGFR